MKGRTKLDENNTANLQLAYRIIRNKIEGQDRTNQSLDAKLGILFGFVGVIIVGVISMVNTKHSLVGINMFTGGLTALLVCIVCLVVASATRRFLDPVDFDAFYSEKVLSKDNKDILNQVISDTNQCYKKNTKIIKNKAFLFDMSVYSLGSALALLFMGIII
jgi:hypothetical protein